MTARSIVLFLTAAIAEIGDAHLVGVGIKDHDGIAFVALGAMPPPPAALSPVQSSQKFGRVPATYGGVFIIGSPLWRVARRSRWPRADRGYGSPLRGRLASSLSRSEPPGGESGLSTSLLLGRRRRREAARSMESSRDGCQRGHARLLGDAVERLAVLPHGGGPRA